MSVTIRRAVKGDAQAVAALALKLVMQHQEYDPVRFSRLGDLEGMAQFYGSQTEVEDAAVFVAEVDAKIVGFAFVQYEDRNYAGLLRTAAWLHDIYIEESARRAQIGKQMIEAATEAAKGFGAD